MSNPIANQLFLAYLGRPADTQWRNSTGNLLNGNQPSTALQTAFYNAAVADGVFATTDSPSTLINKIFNQLFGFSASTFEQNAWGNLITTGVISAQTAAWTIFSSYLGASNVPDSYKVPAQSKLIAADAYVTQLANDPAANAALSQAGSTAATSARTFLTGITTQAQAATAVTNIATTVATVGTSTTTGSTFTLTTGVDTFTGTTSADSFSGSISTATAASNTFGAVDVLAGGAGNDTLNITAIDYANNDALPAASVSAIETINIRAVDATPGDNLSVNASNFTGHTAINADRSTSALTITNVATGASVGIIGNGVATNGTLNVGYATAATPATLNVQNGVTGGPAVNITSNPTSVTINSTGAANTLGAVDLSASASLTSATINATTNLTVTSLSNDFSAATNDTLTISGAATLVTLGTLPATLEVVNASGMTAGGISATMSATTTLAITGGTGNDTITTGSVLTTGSVAAGSGTDRLNVADSTHLNTAALGAKYTGFETLGVTNGVAVDLDHISGITGVVMTDGAGTTSLTNLSAAQAAAVTLAGLNGAATLGVKGAATVGQLDTVTITVNDGNSTTGQAISTAGDLTIASVETINFAAVDNLTLATIANMNSFTTVNLSGVGTSEIYTAANAVVLNAAINGSTATGTVRVNATAATTNGMALTGGSGNDQLTGSAQADALVGGAGNDVLFGLAAADTITGGAGNDFVSGGAAADTLTGGDGVDTFEVTTDGATTIDTIADLVLGTDLIAVTAAPSGGVVTTVFAGSGTLAAAAADAGTSIGANKAGIFTHSGSSYLLINDGTAGTIAATDTIVKINGYTGTLATSTFTTTGATIVSVGGATQTITGTVAADTITTGTAIANITAGGGADTITLGATNAVADTIFFSATTAAAIAVESGVNAGANGTGDSITNFEAAAGTDVISFATALLDNGTKTTTLSKINKAGTIANNEVLVNVQNTAVGDAVDTVNGAVTILNALTSSDVAIGERVIVAMDNDTDMFLWLINQISTADTIAAQDITLIGVIKGVAAINDADLTYA